MTRKDEVKKKKWIRYWMELPLSLWSNQKLSSCLTPVSANYDSHNMIDKK